MSSKEKAKRYFVFLIGLFVNSLGVSFITKASLGTSPISSVPYVLSIIFPFSLGQFTFVFNLLIIALQIVILRKNFKKESLLQLPVVFLFSCFIDLTMYLLSFMSPQTYVIKFTELIIGCGILGFGVYIEILADVVMLPGEALVRAISSTWNTDFGKTKVAVDSAMSVSSAIIAIIALGGLKGVREGTVVAAILVGMTARAINKKLHFMPKILFK